MLDPQQILALIGAGGAFATITTIVAVTPSPHEIARRMDKSAKRSGGGVPAKAAPLAGKRRDPLNPIAFQREWVAEAAAQGAPVVPCDAYQPTQQSHPIPTNDVEAFAWWFRDYIYIPHTPSDEDVIACKDWLRSYSEFCTSRDTSPLQGEILFAELAAHASSSHCGIRQDGGLTGARLNIATAVHG